MQVKHQGFLSKPRETFHLFTSETFLNSESEESAVSKMSGCAPPTQTQALLSPLQNIDEENLPNVFLEKLDSIFSYSLDDVQKALSDYSREGLCKLHKSLCAKVAETFTQFKDRKPINRQVKKTLLSDIAILGYSLANNSPLRDVDKVFHPTTTFHGQTQAADSPAPNFAEQSEFAELIKVVASLKAKVTQLEKDLVQVRAQLGTVSSIPTDSPTPGAPQPSTDQPQSLEQNEEAAASSSASDTEGSVVDVPVEADFHQTRRQRKKARRHQRKVEARQAAAGQAAAREAAANQATNVDSGPGIPSRPVSPAMTQSVPEATSQDPPRPVQPAQVKPVTAAAPQVKLTTIYIGGVSASNSPNDIKSHVLSLGATTCESVKVLHTDRNWKSFRADIPMHQKDMICDEQKWDSRIKVRPFRPFQDQRRGVSRGSYRAQWSRSDNHQRQHASQRSRRNHHYSQLSNQRARYTPYRGNNRVISESDQFTDWDQPQRSSRWDQHRTRDSWSPRQRGF